MIPRVKFSIDSSKYLEKPKKIDNMSDAIHTRDPFASLSQKNSKKVLSPYRKLPKLAIALPPRLSLNSKNGFSWCLLLYMSACYPHVITRIKEKYNSQDSEQNNREMYNKIDESSMLFLNVLNEENKLY